MMAALFVSLLICSAGPDAGVHLIAHRGGVVDDRHAENTRASLQAALERGYWMIETDIRRTRDGELVVQHDPDFGRIYGVSKKVSECTWDEARQFRSRIGSLPIMTLRDLAEACRGKTHLMIDMQESDLPETALAKMEKALDEHDLLRTAFFIGSGRAKAYFKGKGRVSVDRNGLQAAIKAGEPVSKLYFLFEHGNVLDEETVKLAASVQVPVVASVNTFHYFGKRARSGPEDDIRRLRQLGVQYFQIDSVYERSFQEP